MTEISKVYREALPSLRLIGKRYTNLDRGPLGGFGLKWEEWFQKDYYLPLYRLGPLPESNCIGCMRVQEDFEYWTGMFFPADTPVPTGYQFADIPPGDIGVCWLYGRRNSGELYGEYLHDLCIQKLLETGWEIAENSWFFERHVDSRFLRPDEKGKVVIDYCIYLKK